MPKKANPGRDFQGRLVFVDPGPDLSGLVIIEGFVRCGHVEFEAVAAWCDALRPSDRLVMEEMSARRGVILSNRVRDTLKIMGRWEQMARAGRCPVSYVEARDVRIALFGANKATWTEGGKKKSRGWSKTEIRTRLLELWGGEGDATKPKEHSAYGGAKCPACKGKGWRGRGRPECEPCEGSGYSVPPGPLHKLPESASAHEWSALAVGLVAITGESDSREVHHGLERYDENPRLDTRPAALVGSAIKAGTTERQPWQCACAALNDSEQERCFRCNRRRPDSRTYREVVSWQKGSA